MNISIADRPIGQDYPPYIIAEMSANHNGKIENAFKILEMAKRCGADAVKMQTYTPDTITLKSSNQEFKIESGLWKGKTLYEIYSEAHTPWEWHESLFKKAKELDITLFSSPFDNTAVDLLEDLKAPAYKIASFEVIDLPLIKRVAQTGKPMIISTGMANQTEISEAVQTARDNGCSELLILHCVSGYPARSEEYNLQILQDLAKSYDVLVGLSDHTLDNHVAIASVALGACAIEKHVTLNRKAGGPDDSFSIEAHELKNLLKATKEIWKALGDVNFKPKRSEEVNIKFRRSIYATKRIQAGEKFTAKNIKSIRPGFGLPPRDYEKILGKSAVKTIEAATPLSWDLIN